MTEDDRSDEDLDEMTVADLLAKEPPEPPDDPVEALEVHSVEVLDIQRAMKDSMAREHTVEAMTRLEEAAQMERKYREQVE